MQHQLSCEQVTALLTFYAEGTLSHKLAKYVEKHLQNCPECSEKFAKLKNLVNKFSGVVEPEPETNYNTSQYEDFKSNLSAYIDNELDFEDNIKIKKIVISNPLARQDLENTYSFKRMLHGAFERTKNDMKTDYSKTIVHQIRSESDTQFIQERFFQLTAVFLVMIFCILSGIIAFLYL